MKTQAELINPRKSENILGGIISQNLKFTEHIQNHEDSMLKVLNNRINALKKVSNSGSFKIKKNDSEWDHNFKTSVFDPLVVWL